MLGRLLSHFRGPATPSWVLIVEDDSFLKPLLTKIIQSIDPVLTIRWVSTVAGARKELEIGLPALMIVDCLLGPEESGLQLWKDCCDRKIEVPFLLLTGLCAEALRGLSSSGRRGLPAVVQKPFKVPELQAQLRKMLKKSA